MSDEPVSSTKVAVWTALITATATVLTAFIGVFPQLRQNDQKTIGDLTKQVSGLTSEVQGLTAKIAEDAYTVSGSVKTKKNSAPVTNGSLYAATADDSVPLDDGGNFVFSHMLNKPYWIVLDTQNGQKGRLLISPGTVQTASDELEVTYNFSPK
jgi:hypothetical protein